MEACAENKKRADEEIERYGLVTGFNLRYTALALI